MSKGEHKATNELIRVAVDADGLLRTKPEGVYLETPPTLVDGEQHRLTLTDDGRLRVEGGDVPEHGADSHFDVTRSIFIPAIDDNDVNVIQSTLGYYQTKRMPDANSSVWFTIMVPLNFVSFTSVKLIWSSPAAAGNMNWHLLAHYAGDGEAYNTHTDAPARGVTATSGANRINIQEPLNPLTLANLAIGDVLGIRYFRVVLAEDTLDDIVHALGLIFTYVADQ